MAKNETDKMQEKLEEVTGAAKFRMLSSPSVRSFLQIVLALIPIIGVLYILGIHQRLGLNLYVQQYVGIFLGLLLIAIFVSVPAGGTSSRDKVPWYDWILALLGFVVGIYIFIFYPEITRSFVILTTERVIMSVLAILLILESIRRALGYTMLMIVLFFIVYALFAPYFPGILKGTPTGPGQLFNYLYLDANSMLTLLKIAGTIGLAFILFGQVLILFKGGDILNNLALGMFGRYRGGPAKGSVIGSSLAGSISGSAVTNVILTGSVTIPLMKRNGFTSVQAGALESVASTGGSIMPPVMGIAAFIIAENLGVRYAEVALAALIPAILYYLCLFFQVDFMVGRQNIARLGKNEIPPLQKTLKIGWIIFPPLLFLIYLLFFKGMTPQTAGVYSTFVAAIFLVFQKEVWQNLSALIKNIFVETGKVMLDLGIVLAAAGLVVGATSVSGLGFNMAFILASLGEHGLLLLLIVSAIVSIILGMGMPSVAAYSLAAVLVAPAIVEFGIPPLAAHLFVFYFAIISAFTPPIAMACFAAAPIAKSDPHRIGFRAMKFGIVAYLIPFVFIYSPGILILSENTVLWTSTLLSFVTASVACYLLAAVVEGFWIQKITFMKRVFLAVLSLGLFMPLSLWEHSWIVNLITFILSCIFFFIEWRGLKRESHPFTPQV